MTVEEDLESGATYVSVSDAPVARTVHVTDLVLVDVDEHGDPVGVDIATPVGSLTWDNTFTALFAAFPRLKEPLAQAFGL